MREFKTSKICLCLCWGGADQAVIAELGNGLIAEFLKVSDAFSNSPTNITRAVVGLILPRSAPVEAEKVNSLGDYLQSVWKV